MRLELGRREIFQVESHDHVRPALDGCREHMPVIGVREHEPGKERFIPSNQRVRDGPIHEVPGAIEGGGTQVRALREKVAGPLFMDRVRPSRAEQTRAGKLQKKIPQWCGIEHAGIVDGRDPGHASIAHPQLLRLQGQFIERFVPVGHRAFPVFDDILEKHPAVLAHLAEADLPELEQFQKRWARHFQKLGGLLCRHLPSQGNHRDRVSLGHFRKDLHQHPECGHRNRGRLGTFRFPGLKAEIDKCIRANQDTETAAGIAGKFQITGTRQP